MFDGMFNRRHRRPWPAVEEKNMNVFALIVILAILVFIVVVLFVFGCIILGSISDKEIAKYLDGKKEHENED